MIARATKDDTCGTRRDEGWSNSSWKTSGSSPNLMKSSRVLAFVQRIHVPREHPLLFVRCWYQWNLRVQNLLVDQSVYSISFKLVLCSSYSIHLHANERRKRRNNERGFVSTHRSMATLTSVQFRISLNKSFKSLSVISNAKLPIKSVLDGALSCVVLVSGLATYWTVIRRPSTCRPCILPTAAPEASVFSNST